MTYFFFYPISLICSSFLQTSLTKFSTISTQLPVYITIYRIYVYLVMLRLDIFGVLSLELEYFLIPNYSSGISIIFYIVLGPSFCVLPSINQYSVSLPTPFIQLLEFLWKTIILLMNIWISDSDGFVSSALIFSISLYCLFSYWNLRTLELKHIEIKIMTSSIIKKTVKQIMIASAKSIAQQPIMIIKYNYIVIFYGYHRRSKLNSIFLTLQFWFRFQQGKLGIGVEWAIQCGLRLIHMEWNSSTESGKSSKSMESSCQKIGK